MRRHVVVFARAPALGRVKRRLAAGVGAVEAVRFNRVAMARLLRRLGRDPRWTVWLAVTPDGAGAGRWWPPAVPRIGQGRGDLGRRMLHAFRRLPPGPAVLLGSDIPDAGAAEVAAAFAALRGHDMVLGPAADGGYWLVGFARRPRAPGLLEGVRWSSAWALADTVRSAGRLRVAMAGRLGDVDDAAAWRRWRAGLPIVPAVVTAVIPPGTGAPSGGA